MRAPTITSPALDSVAVGDIDIESSSENVMGRSRTRFFMMASGIRGPCTGRAKTYTTSSGDTVAASAGASVTVPATVPPDAAAAGVLGAAGGLRRLALPGGGRRPTKL